MNFAPGCQDKRPAMGDDHLQGQVQHLGPTLGLRLVREGRHQEGDPCRGCVGQQETRSDNLHHDSFHGLRELDPGRRRFKP